jgi:streptogramin lyase
VFAGGSIWITDNVSSSLIKLNPDGSVAQSIPVGLHPVFPAFDGKNIWVPNFGDSSLTVVRASDGAVLQTFSAANGNQNGLSSPREVAINGVRAVVTNQTGSISLFKIADLSPMGNVPTPGMSSPFGVASDGVNFWISDNGSGKIGRF